MVCPTCSTAYCKCNHKECPTCAEATRLGKVLVEYRGTQPRYSLLGYTFKQVSPRSYVQKYDVPHLVGDPNLVVVGGAPA